MVKPPRVQLCGGCGSALPKGTRACPGCGAGTGGAFEAALDERLILGVWCTFQCRSCGFASPLDALDASGGAFCLKCGLHQRFPVQSWVDALAWAHGVADLAGPSPEGRHPDARWSIRGENPFADLAVSRFKATHAQSGTLPDGAGHVPRTLKVDAAIGHPLCDTCHKPVAVEVGGRGQVHTRCAGCGETASYETPADVLALAEGLVGVIALEHRVDRPEAGRGAAQSFTCGSCGGPLPVNGTSRLVSCGFCQKVSRIPLVALQGLAAPPPPDHWWWIFEGRSTQRATLLRERDEPAGTDRKIADPPRSLAWDARRVARLAFLLGGATAALAVGTSIYGSLWFLMTIVR